MAERRRIRLAAVPYEETVEGDEDSTQNFRRVAYRDEGYEPSIEKPKKRRTKVTVQSTKQKSRSRKKSRRKASRTQKKVPNGESSLIEELETTTWSLLKCGRKFIEKSIEEGKAQALKAAIRLRQEDTDINSEQRDGRVTRRRRKKNQLRNRRPSLHTSSSDDSRSIRSASSYGSYSDSYGTFSYSDGEPSMSLSVSSSKSSKKRKSSKSKSNLKAESSFDSLGDNSIIADDSYTTKDSSTSTEESLTDRTSSEDDHSVVSGAWSKIDKIVDKPSGESETQRPSGAMKMEFLLEPDSSDSWIESIQTDSIGSFSSALNKELSYHRQLSSTTSLEPIQRRIDEISDSSKKGHQRKPTTELSDAEFLKVIRETVDQELGAKQTAETESNQDFMAMIDKSTEQDPSPIAVSALSALDILEKIQQDNVVSESSPASPVLSNADFLKAMQHENGVEAEEVEATPASPILSNADFLQAMQQENGVEEGQVEATPASPILSNADFLQAMQQENGVEEEQVEASPGEPILSNTDFLKAMQQENGVEEEQVEATADEPILSNTDFLKAMQQDNGVEFETPPASEPILSNADFLKAMQQENGDIDGPQCTAESRSEPVVLSNELSNADFLEAMKLSLSTTGGKFEQEPQESGFSTEASSEYQEYKDAEQGFSNADFLKVLQQTGAVDDDAFSENKTSTQTAVNASFLTAVKQMGGMGHDSSMYSHGKLATIPEVDSPDPSPPTSYTLTEEDVVVVMDCDCSLSDASPLAKQQIGPEIVMDCDCSVSEVAPLVKQQNAAEVVMDCDESIIDDATLAKQQHGSEVVMDCDESLADDAPLVKHQIGPDQNVELIDQGWAREALIGKPIESAPSMELPDLKCLSSEGSDTLFEPKVDKLHDVGRESDKDDVNDSDTGFMTADDILAEDDTHFFSLLTEKKANDDEIGQRDSLDDILGDTNAHEVPTRAKIDGIDQDRETKIECRQDEESSPYSSVDQEEMGRSPDVSRDDIEERKALVRAIEVDESLTQEEKRLLIDDIANGASIDVSLSCGTSMSETQSIRGQSRMEINKAIGKKVMQGWTLLNTSCPLCMLPLMTDTSAVEATCIFCDYSRSMNGAKLSALPPPPPPPMANKKAKKKRTKTQTTMGTISAKHPNSFVVGSE